jgi:hypothetical protein
MAKKSPNKIPPGSELDTLTAENVFGWKYVHKHDGALIGKKQDKAGRWRSAKVPQYSSDPREAYAINERMKQLGRSGRYLKELSGSHASRIFPPIGPRPEQRVRAALKVLGK